MCGLEVGVPAPLLVQLVRWGREARACLIASSLDADGEAGTGMACMEAMPPYLLLVFNHSGRNEGPWCGGHKCISPFDVSCMLVGGNVVCPQHVGMVRVAAGMYCCIYPGCTVLFFIQSVSIV